MTIERRPPARPLLQHVAMSQFPVRAGELIVGGMSLTRLAARVGQTPFYAYDRGLLRDRVAQLRSALPAAVKLHYAMKANPMPALVCFMATLVDGVDVASAGELQVALDGGADPQEISFAGPGKRDAELRQAVAAGVLVNLESAREIRPLAAASQELGLPARVAVRVNPDFELKGSGMKMGGGPKPFGVDAEAVPALLRDIAAAGLQFEGFHLFAGSQNLRAEAICEAQRQSYALAVRLAADAPAPVRSVNLGGGFGIPYFPGESRLDLAPIGDNLAVLVERAAREVPAATLVLELGRFLVGEAGIYVCRVIDSKISRGERFVVTDGGLHHHLAATGNFGQVVRRNYPVGLGSQMTTPPSGLATVTGPLCTPLDKLAEQVPLADALIGELVVIFQSGAYGASASPERFLLHPACAQVLI